MHGRQSQRRLRGQRTQRLPGDTSPTAIGVLAALLTRRWLRLLLSAVLLAAIVGTVAWAVVPALAGRDTAAAVGYYGANNYRVLASVRAAGWPQQKNNWCGVATIAAIAQYRGHAVSQTGVANFLNSNVAPGGPPPRSSTYWGPGFQADISGDVGTDPRSLAEGLTVEAQGKYHQLVDPGTNYDATMHLISDLVRSAEPISVIVYHGLHSVLVSTAVATSNPVTDPASILGLDVWDPGYGIPNGNIQAAQEVFVPIHTWLTSTYYWGTPYSANYYGSIASDPDPLIGPYAYNPSQNDNVHLWVTHYVYLRPDAATASAVSVSADWAVSPSGALIVGEHGEVPQGYIGQEIVLPVISHLGYTSIDGPALWTDSTYPPVQRDPALPMSVLAWTGTDSHHLLNVSTSTNGLTYGNHITLGYTSYTRPSVLVIPAGTGWVVDLAWVSATSPHALYFLSNAYGAHKTIQVQGSSASAPSLAYFGGQVWIAWVGTDSKHTVNIVDLGATGLTPILIRTLPSATNTQAPDLTNDTADGKLLLSWEVAGTHYLNFESSSDGTTWTEGLATPVTLHSTYTPSLLAATFASTSSPPTQVDYAWCWTAEDLDRSVNITYSSNLATWSGPVTTLLISSLEAPALGYSGANQELILAWTQTAGQDIDVAILPANGS